MRDDADRERQERREADAFAERIADVDSANRNG
jgi:hypothetical protein